MSTTDEKKHDSAKDFYSSTAVAGPWDVVIIGSGASALTSGAMLAKAGKRVLLLEQHFQPGGYTHTFSRKNYEWDVGLHYLGKAVHTSPWYHQLTALTDNRIPLAPFEGFTDELVFPDFRLRMPHQYDEYRDALTSAFPHEAKGIGSYLEEIRKARRSLQMFYGFNLLPPGLTALGRRTFGRAGAKYALSTTEQIMSRHIQDEKLKAVLDAQWGNIGAPRQHCSFLIHSAMLGNFLESGAEYPIGGSGVFARELGRVIAAGGGHLRTKAKVEKLLVNGKRIAGVQLASGETIECKSVISSIGVFNTYLNLLDGVEGCESAVDEVRKLTPAYEYINLFIGFKQSPADFGLGQGNAWIYPEWQPGTPTWNVADTENDPYPHAMFFSSGSLRDPSLATRRRSGFTGQIVSAVTHGSFDKWAGSKWKHREEAYHQFKAHITERLMCLLDEKYPGIKGAVDYTELGTTLSYDYFCSSHLGIPYGLSSGPERFQSRWARPTTPIRNLYLCGQDMIMPGVPAAVGSASLCCALILRKNIGGYWTKKGKKMNGIV